MAGVPYECEMIRERLPEYADGVLIGPDLARVEQHVANCARCQREVADLRLVITAVRSLPADEAPDTLAPRVRRAVQERGLSPGGRLLWPRLAIPVAVLTGLIAVTFALRVPQQQFAPAARAVSSPLEMARKAAGGGGGGVRGGAARSRREQAAPANAPAEKAPSPPASALSASVDQTQGAGSATPPSLAGEIRVAEKPEAPQSPAQVLTPPPQPKLQRTFDGAAGGAGGGGRGGGGAAGGGARGSGRGGGAPAGGEAAQFEAPPAPPGAVGRASPYAAHQNRDQLEEPAEERAGGAAARSAPKSEAAAAPTPPAFARASLVKSAGRNVIALNVASEAPADTITLRLAGGPPQVYTWRGAGTRPATIPLPPDKIGPGPAAVPLELTSSAGTRSYVLFLPVMSRLGEVAPAAPVISYQAAPLQSVLADLSRMTGLVILAEQPLDAEIKGAAPKGTPGASLRQLAAANGFEVQAQGDLVFTLTHRR